MLKHFPPPAWVTHWYAAPHSQVCLQTKYSIHGVCILLTLTPLHLMPPCFPSHCNMFLHRYQNTLTPPASAMHLCVAIPAMCTASNPAHFFTTTVKDAAHASESVFRYLPPCCARHRIFPHTHTRKAAGAAAAAPKVVTCPAFDPCGVPVWMLPSLPSLRLLLLLPPPPSPRPLLTASAEEGGGSSSGSSRSSGRESRNRTKIDRLPC